MGKRAKSTSSRQLRILRPGCHFKPIRLPATQFTSLLLAHLPIASSAHSGRPDATRVKEVNQESLQGLFYPSGRQRCVFGRAYRSLSRQITREKVSASRQDLGSPPSKG